MDEGKTKKDSYQFNQNWIPFSEREIFQPVGLKIIYVIKCFSYYEIALFYPLLA